VVKKKATCFFQIDPRPFRSRIGRQAKGTLARDKANQMKNKTADEKGGAVDLFNKKVISAQERDTSHLQPPGRIEQMWKQTKQR